MKWRLRLPKDRLGVPEILARGGSRGSLAIGIFEP